MNLDVDGLDLVRHGLRPGQDEHQRARRGRGKFASLTRSFTVADAKGTIPSSLLTKFEAASTNFFIGGVETSSQTLAGDGHVTFALQATATREGGIAAGLATLQHSRLT